MQAYYCYEAKQGVLLRISRGNSKRIITYITLKRNRKHSFFGRRLRLISDEFYTGTLQTERCVCGVCGVLACSVWVV